MNHWMCDDKSLILPLRDLHQMCYGRPPEPKGNLSLVSQKGSNFFLRIDPNIYAGASLDWQLGQGSIYNTDNLGFLRKYYLIFV